MTLADRARPGEPYRRVFVILADKARCSCLRYILGDGVVRYMIYMLYIVELYMVWNSLSFVLTPPFPLLVAGISGDKKGKELA